MKRMEVTKNGCSTAQLQEVVQTSTPWDSTEASVERMVRARHVYKMTEHPSRDHLLDFLGSTLGSFAQGEEGGGSPTP